PDRRATDRMGLGKPPQSTGSGHADSRKPRLKKLSRPLTTFTDLGVLPEIADALSDVGITQPFPIQEMTLSVALMGTDLIGQARTGTGKTLAFAIPVVQRTIAPHDPEYADVVEPGKPQALILTPTRDLTIH